MGKRMLRSVLVATFSAVVAFGALSGLSGTRGDVRADSVWSLVSASSVTHDGNAPVGTDDSVWS
jgi:hypothetical protein